MVHTMQNGRHFHRLAVFCGASDGVDPVYLEAAKEMGRELVKQRIKLVYGGGTTGLMGALAREVVAGSGDSAVLGVIPHALTPREVSGDMIGETIMVNDMHTRKALMAKHADAFIAMPGGFGTLEELMEVLTWQQLGFHEKPIGILNINDFYTPFLGFFKHCIKEGFVKPQHDTVIVSTDPADLIQKLGQFRPPQNLIQVRMASVAAVGEDLTYESESSDSGAENDEVGEMRKEPTGIDIRNLNIAGGACRTRLSQSPMMKSPFGSLGSPFLGGGLTQAVQDI